MWWHHFICGERVALTYWLWLYVDLYWHETFSREAGEVSVSFPNGIAVSCSPFPCSFQKSFISIRPPSFHLPVLSFHLFALCGLFLMLLCAPVLQLCGTSFYSGSAVVMLMILSSNKNIPSASSVCHSSCNSF